MFTHFLETDQPALSPLAPEPFAFFHSGVRTVHPDGHVELDGSFYPAPIGVLNQEIRVRWDRHLVRLYQGDTLIAVHQHLTPEHYAPRPGASPHETTSTQRAFAEQLLGRCQRVGPPLHLWAEDAIRERGVRAYRLIQGVLGLTRTHPRERLLHAAQRAQEHGLFRYRDLKRLTKTASVPAPAPVLLAEHESIRPMTDYRSALRPPFEAGLDQSNLSVSMESEGLSPGF